TELSGQLRRLVVQVPADLEVVGDEPDRADQHVPNALRVKFPQVVEDVGPEPGLTRLGLALEGERPCLERCALCDQLGGLEELLFVWVARIENAGGQRMSGEDDMGVRSAHALRDQLDEARLVVPALDERELGSTAEPAFQLVAVARDG